MPRFDLANPAHQLAECLDAPDSARRHAFATLVQRHCGAQAKADMIAAYKAVMIEKRDAAIKARAELKGWAANV